MANNITIQNPCLILVRHGESEGNVDNEIYRNKPDWKVELTEEGYENAISLGKMLSAVLPGHIANIIYSPYLRTEDTAKAISLAFPRRHLLSEDARLREQSWGNYSEHINRQTLREKDSYGEFFYQVAGGESVAQVYDRAVQFMHNLVVTGQTIILVSHGIFLRTLTMYLNKIPAKNFEQVERLHNCDADIYEFTNINTEYKRIYGIRNLQIV